MSNTSRVNSNNNNVTDVAALDAALTLLSTITTKDLMAVQKAHKGVSALAMEALRESSGGQLLRSYSAEQSRLRKNEAQKAFRSTPEGRAYANEAAKKSIAAKKNKAKYNERVEGQPYGRRVGDLK